MRRADALAGGGAGRRPHGRRRRGHRAGAKDTLVIGMPTDVPIFDTHKATGLHNGGILNQVSEPLVRLTNDGKVVPWLVESWEQSKDGKTWTLHTRKGVTFTDGTPFNAEALRFNLERFRKHSIGKATLAMVKSMDVAGEHELKVTTEAPFAPFINSLGYHWIVVYSPTQIQKVGDDNLHTAPVGTGPFKFVHHKRGQEVRLEANDQYWGGKPELRAIVSRPYPDQGARMLALESGGRRPDLPRPTQEARGSRRSRPRGVHPPSARVIWIYLNTQRDPFKDKRVRQAIYLAIDREAIVKNIFAGTAKALHSPGPVGSYGYTDKYDTLGYNPERAKQLLKDAGSATSASRCTTRPAATCSRARWSEAIQGYLKQVGVTMRVTDLEWGALSQLTAQPVEKSQVQAVLFGWRSGQRRHRQRHPGLRLGVLAAQGQQRLVLEERRVRSPADVRAGHARRQEALEALHRMQEILMDEMPALLALRRAADLGGQAHAKGVEWNPLGVHPSLHAALLED
jgi:peptide/nickel transport system substrate-binding protein